MEFFYAIKKRAPRFPCSAELSGKKEFPPAGAADPAAAKPWPTAEPPVTERFRHAARGRVRRPARSSPGIGDKRDPASWNGSENTALIHAAKVVADAEARNTGKTYLVGRAASGADALDELLADVNSGHNIAATVFIQCGSGYRTSGPEEMRPIGESEFVRAIAKEGDRRGGKTKICAGIVSFADLRLPNVDAVLEGQIAAAGGRFRGIG
ncbi:MAG TPA: hypothetical protein VGH47_15255 [Xanthobacteraceae bacterium]